MFNRIKRLLRPPPQGPPAARPATAARPAQPPAAAPAALLLPPPDGLHHTLLLYKYDACPYCRNVARAIDGLGLSVPTADTRQDPQASRALLALTGGTQVPCLVIDGVPLLESADIIAWLQAWQAARATSATSA